MSFPNTSPALLNKKRFITVPSIHTLLVVLSLLTLVGLMPAGAQELCDPCVVQVMPKATSVTIPLYDWFAGQGTAISEHAYTLGDPSLQHGSGSLDVVGGAYTYYPGMSFWTVGVDQVVLDVSAGDDLLDGTRTIIFLAANTYVFYEQNVNFSELGSLGELQQKGWSSLHVDESALALEQKGGVNVFSVPSMDGESHGLSDSGSGDAYTETAGLGGEVNASAEDVGGDDYEKNEFLLSVAGVVKIERLTRVVGGVVESTQARGVMNAALFDCGICETDWVEIPDPDNQFLNVEVAQRMEGTGADDQSWSLQFYVEEADGTLLNDEIKEIWTSRTITPFPTLISTSVGSLNVSINDPSVSTTTEISSFHTYASRFGSAGLQFANDYDASTDIGSYNGLALDFEGRDAQSNVGQGGARGEGSELQTTGDIALTVELDQLIPTIYPNGYSFPGDVGSRSTLTYYDLNQAQEVRVKMVIFSKYKTYNYLSDYYPAWTSFQLLQIGSNDGIQDIGPVNLRFSTDASGNRRFRISAFDSAGVKTVSPWLTVGSQDLDLSMMWRQNDGGTENPNGFVKLIVNGQSMSITGLENSGQVAEYVTFGAWDLKLNAMPPSSWMFPLSFDEVIIAAE